MKKTGNIKMKLAILLAVIVIAVSVPFAVYQIYLNNPVGKGEAVDINIKQGTNKNILVRDLNKQGIITNKIFAKIYLRNVSADETFKPGHYKIEMSMTPREIMEKIINSELDANYITITIPEGYTNKQIATRLLEKGLISSSEKFLEECSLGEFDYTFLEDIKVDRKARLEGYLFPATYEFKKGVSYHQIIDSMLKRFNKVYNNTILPSIGDRNIDDVMKLASIVEKEAKLKDEQAKIASVFTNRIEKGIRLQSCATVQYILDKHKEVLSTKDTKIDSPYNTYRYKGLPLGPICNPGEPAISAALKPENTDYLYFVVNYAKNDGSHNFAKTYKEFLKYKNQK